MSSTNESQAGFRTQMARGGRRGRGYKGRGRGRGYKGRGRGSHGHHTAPPSVPAVVDKKCQVCSEADFKYKCPKCFTKYCSVLCFKDHKEQLCEERKSQLQLAGTAPGNVNAKNSYDSMHSTSRDDSRGSSGHDPDRVDDDVLATLPNSAVLTDLLRSSDLRKILIEIDTARDGEALVKSAMDIPIFVEFVDECLNVCSSASSTPHS